MNAYWESTEPGFGRRSARAQAPSDAPVLSLNGTWRFRLTPTAAGTGSGFIADEFDDSGWDAMRVPSHWVLEPFTPLAGGPARLMLGTEEGPLYTNTSYPIPLDAPRVSTENPTGDYRLVFDVPEDFGAAVLRFQGVDSCAKVWLNGEELGWSMGSRLPFEFDAPVRAGRNVLAVRVHRWSAGTYLEDQDMWWLPGIFRDVELLARPVGAIDDHFVHADYDPATGIGTFRVDASCPATAELPELGIRVAAGESVSVAVEPWSADVPRLYRGSLTSAGERVELAVGFRRVEIVDGVFMVNGRAVTLRGMNRHEHHPETGRTLDRETMIRDIELMKRANIDAVRTSHYPPHPEFLRLCDEYGLWVVLECDLETHGFIYAGWQGNPPADPRWRGTLMDRLYRTVERDKNHPSIVIWSLANESWVGAAFGEMREWLAQRDPSRPVLYERDPRYRDSDFYSLMYPSLELLEQIGRREEPRGGKIGMHGIVFDDGDGDETSSGISDADDERRRTLPFLMVEYAHAMGNGPGSLQDYQRIINAHDRLCGGFVWEWIDHGFTATDADGRPFIMHGDNIDYEPRGGRFSLHGVVFSDRTPTPGLVELAKAYAPIEITVDAGSATIVNRRHTSGVEDLVFDVQCGVDAAATILDVPPCEPGETVVVTFPDAADDVVVTVTARLKADARWADAGHIVAWGQRVPAAPEVQHLPASALPTEADGVIRLGTAEFDAQTGRLQRLGATEMDGPWLDLYRAPTENDNGQGDLNDLAAVWRRTTLDRLLHRVDEVRIDGDTVQVAGRTAPRTHPHGVTWRMLWRAVGDGVELEVRAEFDGPWTHTPYMDRDIVVPRLGLRFALPGDMESVEWLGRGPGETYVDSYEGSQFGRFAATIDALQTPYPVPQENGNHEQTRWLRVRGGQHSVRVDGAPEFAFTARRWTSEALAAAMRPSDLVDDGVVWLNVDHAQQGVGSASVGPALPEQYRVARETTTWRMRIAAE